MLRSLTLLLLLAMPALAEAQPASARVQQEAEGYLRPCRAQGGEDRQWCEMVRSEFVKDYLRARAGQYQGQRNVAFLLQGGNDGVAGDAVEACAWRAVIMSSRHTEAGVGDNQNMRTACGRLNSAQQSDATARARQIMRQIAADPVRNPPPRR